MPVDSAQIATSARASDAFSQGPYYDLAEQDIEIQWKTVIWPQISDFDLTCTLDLAAGHGRITAMFQALAQKVYVADISEPAVEFCKRRFAGNPRITVFRNSGYDLAEIPDGHLTAVICFDSMVHFDSDVVREYIRTFARTLVPGGRGFIHHSNITSDPLGEFTNHRHWRNFMSRELFAHWCYKAGLQILRQTTIDWGGGDSFCPDLDCLTVFEKPRVGKP